MSELLNILILAALKQTLTESEEKLLLRFLKRYESRIRDIGERL